MALPKIGNLAPAFTLLDQDGNKVSLKQFKGTKNVVLYFYPKAMTTESRMPEMMVRALAVLM